MSEATSNQIADFAARGLIDRDTGKRMAISEIFGLPERVSNAENAIENLGKNSGGVIVAEGYGVTTDGTDCTEACQAVLNAAKENGLPIRWPNGRILTQPIGLIGLTEESPIVFENTQTTFYRDDDVNNFDEPNRMYSMHLRGSLVEGSLSTAFPYNTSSRGWRLEDETASALVSDNVSSGSFELPVSNIGDFSEGGLVKIQQHRLTPGCETRDFICNGEVNRVRKIVDNGNGTGSIRLHAPLLHGYRTTTPLHDNTATAGSARTVTLRSGPSSESVTRGSRITVDGQVRYVGHYNPATGIVYLAGDMPDFSPAPDSGSRVVIDAPTYVQAIRAPRVVIPEGINFAGRVPAADVEQRGALFLQYTDRADVRCSVGTGFLREVGLIDTSFMPVVRHSYSQDQNGQLGYTWSLHGCSHFLMESQISCNSGSDFDLGGKYSCGPGTLRGHKIIGGSYVADGPDDAGSFSGSDSVATTSGIGSHGTAYNVTYEDCDIYQCKLGIVLKGVGERIKNCRLYGDFERVIDVRDGSNWTIDGLDIYGMDGQWAYNASTGVSGSSLMYLRASTVEGRNTIRNVTARDVKLDNIIQVDVGSSKPWLSIGNWLNRARGKLTVSGFDLDVVSNSDLYLLESFSGAQFATHGWDIDVAPSDIRVVRGTGAYRGLTIGGTSSGAWSDVISSNVTSSFFNRVGRDKFLVCMLDDTALKIPMPIRSTYLHVKALGTQSQNFLFNRYFNRGNASAQIDMGGSSSNAVMNTSPLSGTTGSDGNLSISHDGQFLYVENRTGNGYNGLIEITAC